MNVHVIGIAGSGKTTLAAWISERFGVAAHDLDWVVYEEAGERPELEIVARIDEIRREPGWVTEGAYQQPWLQPLLEAADRIVWLDASLPVCIFEWSNDTWWPNSAATTLIPAGCDSSAFSATPRVLPASSERIRAHCWFPTPQELRAASHPATCGNCSAILRSAARQPEPCWQEQSPPRRALTADC